MNREGYIKYLENKGRSAEYIICCTRAVELFFKQVKKEDIQVTKPDILKFLEYLKNNRGLQNTSRYHYLISLNHYFAFLYQEKIIAKNPCLLLKIRGIKRKTLYKIYTPEELEQLFDNYYQYYVRNYDDTHTAVNYKKQARLGRERNAMILSVLVHQGVTTGEIKRIEIDDIDLLKATIKIRGQRHSNERTLPLKASQIGLLMHYLRNIRPQLLEYYTTESNKLFFPLYGSNTYTDNENIDNVVAVITHQIKTIDKQFLNFKQLRASVITFWLKTNGLRKTQYMIGHRYTSSTENYLPNDLDDLTDDINKLHPFL